MHMVLQSEWVHSNTTLVATADEPCAPLGLLAAGVLLLSRVRRRGTGVDSKLLQPANCNEFYSLDTVKSSASFSGCTLPQRLYTANSEDFAAADTLPAG